MKNLFYLDSNQTLDVDFKLLTENLTGEVVIIHVTNMLRNTSNVKNITEEISSEKLTAHLRTILILSGKYFNKLILI